MKKTISMVAPAASNATTGPSLHPVAAVMGYASNPVQYPTNYSLVVLSDDGDKDKLDSSEVHGQLTVVIEDINNAAPDSLNLLKAVLQFVAPITVPHMFWCTSVSSPDLLPIQFDCLLDIGLHLVIIHEQLVKDLNFHHWKLQEPVISELAMQPDGPKVLEVNDFIK